jgi:hypothetical protein
VIFPPLVFPGLIQDRALQDRRFVTLSKGESKGRVGVGRGRKGREGAVLVGVTKIFWVTFETGDSSSRRKPVRDSQELPKNSLRSYLGWRGLIAMGLNTFWASLRQLRRP